MKSISIEKSSRLLSASNNRKQPLVYIDVNLGARGVHKMVVYVDDNPKDVAHEFAKKHCNQYFNF
jgi:hypothetical protein